jgi:hypothetical protein
MRAHRRLLLLITDYASCLALGSSEWELPFAARGVDPGDVAEIGEAFWTRSTPPRVRTGIGLQIVEQFGGITRHWLPVYHWYPVTPVTVPVIQTSSAQPASPLARWKQTIADSTDLQSQASRWAKALRRVPAGG